MEMDVQLNSSLISGIALILLISGCAQPAPKLPSDYSSIDSSIQISEYKFNKSELTLECDEISQEIVNLKSQINKIDNLIASKRSSEQAIGFFANLFLPPLWVIMNKTDSLKVARLKIHNRVDTLMHLYQHKSCPPH